MRANVGQDRSERDYLKAKLLLFVVLIGSIGCGRHDEITRYTIEVSQAPGELQSLAAGTPSKNAAPSQMLAAIVPKDNQTWFFKLVGPPPAVNRQQDDFATLVKSVRFAGEMALPAWELPAGWRQRGASGMRYATIEVEEEDRKLEITVIPLETMGELDEYVKSNINRWRGQLGLAPVAEIALGDDADGSGSTRRFELSDGTAVTMVNLIGQGSGGPQTTPGFDMANHPPIGDGQLGMELVPPADEWSLTYETPEGWTTGNVDGMRRAAFAVADNERKVEITVINLPRSGGERLANVNRWRQQIKLDNTTATQLAKDLQKIPLAQTTGDYVELVGSAETEPRESILVVLADLGENTWFFKLKGDADLAEQQRENFQDFVRSVRITTSDKASSENVE